jgi:UDP-N-acetylglucosamine acyltransferase
VNIHPTAIVDPGAELGADVVVGPYAVIDGHVVLGDRVTVGAHARITGHTTIGADTEIFSSAVLGEAPQDHKYHHELSYLNIGQRNVIREFVTMHLAVGEGNATTIGDDNMFMAYAHVGHNCVIGNHVVACNYVGLSGGCRIEDRVVLGGMSGLHQFVHIGRMVMVGGYCKVHHDIPPFVIVDGSPLKIYGLNTVGLRRAGFPSLLRNSLKQVFRLLCHDKGNLVEAIKRVRNEHSDVPEIEEFVGFMERSGRSGRHLDPGYNRCATRL